jgi:L-cystine transport system substrate-binding protein
MKDLVKKAALQGSGKKLLALGLSAGLAVSLLGGCGTSPQGSETKTIIVGTGQAYEPYCYLDKDGNLTGYDIKVLKAVNELLPQYKFEFQTYDFANVLLALSAGKVDFAAHQYEINDERQAKYLFGRESYTTYTTHIVVPVGNTTIHALDDLQGKKVMTPTGSNKAYLLEKYNKEHPDNPIILAYVGDASDEEIATGLKNGVWDATLLTKRDMAKLNKAFGNGQDILKLVGEPFSASKTYFIFKQGDTELQEAIDGALQQLKASGRLAEISREVLEDDYTESE